MADTVEERAKELAEQFDWTIEERNVVAAALRDERRKALRDAADIAEDFQMPKGVVGSWRTFVPAALRAEAEREP